ncbi:FkbM family methyltransferase [Pseudosulfitobacter sp. SM2401]|uniref:FkbM family methyltransferase n=1 Tax=Pseudosulfitobacter sp. SM2401 TaxID=3350098 RepID=UPI0036F29C74
MKDAQTIDAKEFITTNGMKFPKDGHFMTGRIRGAMTDGGYEAKETKCLLRVVREDDVVVELGAGMGYTSTLLATKRKIKHIHAFEANPTLIPYLKAVHAANGVENATVTNAVLGSRKGSVDFYVRRNFLASSLTPIEGTNVSSVEKIEMLNTKTVFKSLKPTVLVCDIEGAEADLIPNMDLTGLRAAVIELHPQWIGPEGVNKVFRAFMDAGFAYYARGSTSKVVSFRRAW